jgi:hypothetical protein
MDREYKLAYSQIPIHNNYEILAIFIESVRNMIKRLDPISDILFPLALSYAI